MRALPIGAISTHRLALFSNIFDETLAFHVKFTTAISYGHGMALFTACQRIYYTTYTYALRLFVTVMNKHVVCVPIRLLS